MHLLILFALLTLPSQLGQGRVEQEINEISQHLTTSAVIWDLARNKVGDSAT